MATQWCFRDGVLVQKIDYDYQTGKLRKNRFIRALPCVHLGEETGENYDCCYCGGRKQVAVSRCAIHGECTTQKAGRLITKDPRVVLPEEMDKEYPWCSNCPDYIDEEGQTAEIAPRIVQDLVEKHQQTAIQPRMAIVTAGSGCCCGGGGIQTVCCTNPIPKQLYATVTNLSGCAAMFTSYTLNYTAGTPVGSACSPTVTASWTTLGVSCNGGGTEIVIVVGCNTADNNWYLCSWDAGESTSLPLLPDSVDCGPPLVLTWNSLRVVECCDNGTVKLVISSTPP